MNGWFAECYKCGRIKLLYNTSPKYVRKCLSDLGWDVPEGFYPLYPLCNDCSKEKPIIDVDELFGDIDL